MDRSLCSRFGSILAAAAILVPGPLSADPGKEGKAESAGGRFLYAGDDDWDWASPLGTDTPSELSKYGAMPWSALDWAEEGLKDVRGVLVGTPPSIGDYLTMEGLSAMRANATYKHEPQVPGVIAKLLASDSPPNLLILMQDTGKGGGFEEDDIERLTEFVKGGGRILALDDWQRYPRLLDSVVEAALHARWPKELRPEAAPAKADHPDDKPADPDFVKRVSALVVDLGATAFPIRERAMKELREMGAPALELALELSPDDPEIGARITRLRSLLAPPPPPDSKTVENEERRIKHVASTERIRAAVRKLEVARAPHKIDSIYVDKEGAPIPALMLSFPAP